MNDNEVAVVELIHLFVEVLDGYFGNVGELGLKFTLAAGKNLRECCLHRSAVLAVVLSCMMSVAQSRLSSM